MEFKDIENARKRLNISRAEFCRCLGVHKNNYTRWRTGQSKKISGPIERLVRLLSDRSELLQLLQAYSLEDTMTFEQTLLSALTEKTGPIDEMEAAAQFLLDLYGLRIMRDGKRLDTIEIIKSIVADGDIKSARAIVQCAAENTALYPFVARVAAMHVGAMTTAGNDILTERKPLASVLAKNSDNHKYEPVLPDMLSWVSLGGQLYHKFSPPPTLEVPEHVDVDRDLLDE